MEEAQCTKGWRGRCARAKSPKCTCACGGANHQKPTNEFGKHIAQQRMHGVRPDVVILDDVGPMPKIQASGMVEGDAETRDVYIDGQRLDPKHSQSFRNHSPDGFSWGYGGSGPAQLALAILLRLTTPQKAQNLYQQFKFDVIAALPQDEDFKLTIAFINDWITQH